MEPSPIAAEEARNGPPWIGETVALAREEVRRFVDTALGFIRRPRAFSADWFAGRQRALNPIGFVATALAVSGAVAMLVPQQSEGGLWRALELATMPYVYYASVGVLCHPFLRLAGSRRALSATLAIALFAGGAPGLLVTLTEYLMITLRVALFGPFQQSALRGIPGWAFAPGVLLAYGPFLFYLASLARGLAGLHGVRIGRAAGAVAISLVLLGLVLGVLHSARGFEVGVPHFVIAIRHRTPWPDIWF